MQIHSRRTSDNRRIKIILIWIVGLLLVSLVVPAVVRTVAGVVLYPVVQVETWFTQSNQVLPALWRDKIVMQTQINELEQTIAVASSRDLTQQRLFEENNRLRALLGAPTTTRTVAAVVGKPGDLPYDLIQVDRGTLDGIEVGSPVYIGRDTVIGLVTSVQRTTAFVTLFTTPDFTATVYLTGANVTAVMEGIGGGVARVKVPQGVLLRVNDLVHVPSIYPGLYGEIAWVESEPTQPEQYGYITPQVPIVSLFQVAIAKPSTVTTDAAVISQAILDIQKSLLVIPDVVIATSSATTTASSTTSTESL